MQGYLIYGFGIRLSSLPKEIIDTLSHHYSDNIYYYNEDAVDGIFFLSFKSPWDEGRTDEDSFSSTFEDIKNFKDDNEPGISKLLKTYNLDKFTRYVEFYCSTTEV
jgi:hypothetical protein